LAQLGVKNIVFGSGMARNCPEGFPMEKALEQVFEIACMIADIAKPYGINLTIEPLRKEECNMIHTAADSCNMARRSGRDNFRGHMDLYHFMQGGEKLPDLVIENCASGGHRLEPSTMELCSQASFSDAHECKSIPIIAANVQRMIKPSQSQIWAVLRKDDDIHRVNYSLTAGFLGRLCLSGEIFDIPDKNWQITLEAIKFYGEIAPIIKDGYTKIIECTAEDYSDPAGYQIVLRELGDEALMIVHTFKDGANPPVEKYLENWQITKTFGSDLDGDFRGKAYLLER
jgi:hypothetical protein